MPGGVKAARTARASLRVVRMAAEADVPVIPIVVWGGQRILTKGRRFRLRRAWHSRIVIAVGKPIMVVEWADPDADVVILRAALRELIAEAKLRDDTPPENASGR